jgi:hypothetical protein
MRANQKQIFKLDIDYRELDPIKEGKRKWRFILKRGIRIHIRDLSTKTVQYHDGNGKIWAHHDQFGLYVYPGYCWNGCSPKRWINLFGWVGTPDFHSTRLASLCHDVHYQFAHTEHFPLHKSDVDLLFRDMILKEEEVKIAEIFYAAVKHFGRWTAKDASEGYSRLV